GRTAGSTGDGDITVGQLRVDIERSTAVGTARSGAESGTGSDSPSSTARSGETVDTDEIGGSGPDGHADGFVGVGTDLEALRAEAAVENLAAAEAGGFGDAVQLLLQLSDFA